MTNLNAAAYKDQPWGRFTRKDVKPGDVITVRWIDRPDERDILIELDKHPANYKGDIGGDYLSTKGKVVGFDALQQIVEVGVNLCKSLNSPS